MKINGTFGGFQVGDDYEVLISGVLNISPESFYKGSTAVGIDEALKKTAKMLQEGAKIIDVGAKSTRPLALYGGKKPPTEADELQRVKDVLPAIIEMCEQNQAKVSIDTQSAKVAQYATEVGVAIVNDISGLHADKEMGQVIADAQVDVVLMPCIKLPGDPTTFEDTIQALETSIKLALDAGVPKQAIVIDPGFGGWQGRGSATDLDLLQNYTSFRKLELPIYAGVSRKSTIQTIGGSADPNERLLGSILLTNWLVDHGTHIIRTHDVHATIEGLRIHKFLQDYRHVSD